MWTGVDGDDEGEDDEGGGGGGDGAFNFDDGTTVDTRNENLQQEYMRELIQQEVFERMRNLGGNSSDEEEIPVPAHRGANELPRPTTPDMNSLVYVNPVLDDEEVRIEPQTSVRARVRSGCSCGFCQEPDGPGDSDSSDESILEVEEPSNQFVVMAKYKAELEKDMNNVLETLKKKKETSKKNGGDFDEKVIEKKKLSTSEVLDLKIKDIEKDNERLRMDNEMQQKELSQLKKKLKKLAIFQKSKKGGNNEIETNKSMEDRNIPKEAIIDMEEVITPSPKTQKKNDELVWVKVSFENQLDVDFEFPRSINNEDLFKNIMVNFEVEVEDPESFELKFVIHVGKDRARFFRDYFLSNDSKDRNLDYFCEVNQSGFGKDYLRAELISVDLL